MRKRETERLNIRLEDVRLRCQAFEKEQLLKVLVEVTHAIDKGYQLDAWHVLIDAGIVGIYDEIEEEWKPSEKIRSYPADDGHPRDDEPTA